MNIDQFWELIESTRLSSNNNSSKHGDLITTALSNMELDDIRDYAKIFLTFINRADRYDLKEVVGLILEGKVDDNTWQGFLAWLIGQGKTVYDQVLADPDTLVDFLPERARYDVIAGTYDITSESLYFSWVTGYQAKTGSSELPEFELEFEQPDKGENLREGVTWEEEYQQRLKQKFPKTWERFGAK